MRNIARVLAAASVAGFVYCEERKVKVCPWDKIREGEIYPVTIGMKRLVLVKVGEKVYCVSANCPHQNASLAGGFMNKYNIVCPMHGAEFDVRDGKIKSYPGFRDLKSYEVKQESGQAVVYIEKDKKVLTTSPIQNSPKYLIIGAGAAGIAAAETLRKNNFTGSIKILSNEPTLPYDRTLLSKYFSLTQSDIQYNTESHYLQNSIEIIPNQTVTSIFSHFLITQDKSVYFFDKLLIATGASSKIPEECSSYMGLKNVSNLRNYQDYSKILTSLSVSKSVFIVGNRFLGLEFAANLKITNPDLRIVFFEYEEGALGKVIGKFLYKKVLESLEENGIEMVRKGKILSFDVDDGKVVRVKTDDKDFDTDFVLVATGSVIKTGFVPEYLKNPDGGLYLNEFMQSKWKDIYAAGDIAEYPSRLTGNRERIEHWAVAQEQGRCAALNMMEKKSKFSAVPYFWSSQFLYLEMIGHSNHHTHTISESLSSTQHLTYFFLNNTCIGIAAINCPTIMQKLKIALSKRLIPNHSSFTTTSAILEKIPVCKNCSSNFSNV